MNKSVTVLPVIFFVDKFQRKLTRLIKPEVEKILLLNIKYDVSVYLFHELSVSDWSARPHVKNGG